MKSQCISVTSATASASKISRRETNSQIAANPRCPRFLVAGTAAGSVTEAVKSRGMNSPWLGFDAFVEIQQDLWSL